MPQRRVLLCCPRRLGIGTDSMQSTHSSQQSSRRQCGLKVAKVVYHPHTSRPHIAAEVPSITSSGRPASMSPYLLPACLVATIGPMGQSHLRVVCLRQPASHTLYASCTRCVGMMRPPLPLAVRAQPTGGPVPRGRKGASCLRKSGRLLR